MTTIAYTKGQIVADSTSFIDGIPFPENTKIFRRTIDGVQCLVGSSGDGHTADMMLKSMESHCGGNALATFNPSEINKDDAASIQIVELRPEGPRIWTAGRDFALAAMYCGKTAAEAVEVAKAFNVWTAGPVDTLNHP